MAKEPAFEIIMPLQKLKPLLVASKNEPVAAAFALTADGEAVLLLDRTAMPRKVMTMLKAGANKAKLTLSASSLRFGHAVVDPEVDAALVRFSINKDAPSAMRPKLVEALRKASFSKVEFSVDTALDADAGDDDAPDADEPAPPPPPPPPPVDASQETTLKHALAGLIGRVQTAAAGDAGRLATLLKVAGLANDQLKSGHLAEADATISKLRQVLDATSAPIKAPDPALIGRWQAARSGWQEAMETVDSQISALQQEMRQSGDETLEEIAEFGLNAMTEGHKTALTAAMLEIGAGSADGFASSGQKALAAVQAFQRLIESDERIAACDDNGGIPVSIRDTLSPALAELAAVLAEACAPMRV